MPIEWKGEERRTTAEDHDVLTRIDVNLSNFMRRFDDHIKDDSEKFEKIDAKLDKNTWYIALGIGLLTAIEFFKDKIFGSHS